MVFGFFYPEPNQLAMTSNSEIFNSDKLTRIIGEYPTDGMNSRPGPYLLASAGIHGNEPSGILALQRVFNKLKTNRPYLKGKLIGVSGNMAALKKGVRLIDKDLNRVCTPEFAEQLKTGEAAGFQEGSEFRDLSLIVEAIENNKKQEEFLFMDLHTTSSKTAPYISVNKKAESFNFAKKMPLPVVKGIEKYIPGHFDHFLTLKGHTGFTMEAGQHEDPQSVDYHEAAIWVVMVDNGLLDRSVIDYAYYHDLLKKSSPTQDNFEVTYRLDLKEDQEFVMEPGFENFSAVKKGQLLAKLDGKEILADSDSRVFLPLYQKQGSDGFFIVMPAD